MLFSLKARSFGIKQTVPSEMTALKNTLTNQDDKGKLTEVITRLTNLLKALL